MSAPNFDIDCNYRSHPAYADLPGPNGGFAQDCEALAAEIDHLYAEARFDPAALGQRLRRPVAALERLVREHVNDPRTRLWLRQSLKAAAAMLVQEASVERRRDRSHSVSDTALAQLRQQGLYALTLPPGSGAAWYTALAPLRMQLQAAALVNPAVRQSVGIGADTEVGTAIVRTLRACGAWALAEHYQGAPQHLAFLDLHYSHPGQSWYQNCYADVGLSTAAASYFHCDYSPSGVKLVFYLSPISANCGPFSYVPGSQAWPRSMLRHVLAKTLDRQHRQVFADLRGTNGYYRARFQDHDERRRFAALPPLWQRSSHFGDDLLDHSPAAQLLLAQERPQLADDTVVLFDGSRGYHRGGQCLDGERWAVHLGLDDPHRSSPWQQWRQRLGRWRRLRW